MCVIFGKVYHLRFSPMSDSLKPTGWLAIALMLVCAGMLRAGEQPGAGEPAESQSPKRALELAIDRWIGDLKTGSAVQLASFQQADAEVARGRAAFDRSCTICHDAQRSLSKRKSHSEWVATVRRMAAKPDADVPSGEVAAIAAYLASESGTLDSSEDSSGEPMDGEPPAAGGQTSLFATISPIWRGGNDSNTIEHPGFFPDVWLGAQWQGSGRLSGRVTACTSCHNTNQTGMGFELVDAVVSLRLLGESLHRESACPPRVEATVEMGRFVVPFGAFSGMSHPGIYRTVSAPMMFNMGRRAGPVAPLQPVLPAPYSDEGVNLNTRLRLPGSWSATFDAYAVNGLQTGGPGVFRFSRTYWDNNSDPAVGGRATIGNEMLRLGGSIMAGQLQNDFQPRQDYELVGGDATLRFRELRFYFEYAMRQEDSFPQAESTAYGTVFELEWDVLECFSLLGRYDTLDHRGVLGERDTERFTWGVNVPLAGGSLLMVNVEQWHFSDATPDVDVAGVRWMAAF